MNHFLGGETALAGVLESDGSTIDLGAPGYARALVSAVEPLVELFFSGYEEACSPALRFDFAPLLAAIAKRRGEAAEDTPSAEFCRQQAETLEVDRAEIERRILDYNATLVPFVRLFFLLVARLDCLRSQVGVVEPGALYLALTDNLVLTDQLLGSTGAAIRPPVAATPLREVIVAAMAGAGTMMLRRIDYERSSMVAYQRALAALEAASEERDRLQAAKTKFEQLAVGLRDNVHHLVSTLFELLHTTDPAHEFVGRAAADTVDGILGELAELLATVDDSAQAAIDVAALRDAIQRHAEQLEDLQRAIGRHRMCYSDFGKAVDGLGSTEMAERFEVTFLFVSQVREICSFAEALKEKWGDVGGFADWVGQVKEHRRLEPPQGIEAIELGAGENQLLDGWLDIISSLNQNLATVMGPLAWVETGTTWLGSY